MPTPQQKSSGKLSARKSRSPQKPKQCPLCNPYLKKPLGDIATKRWRQNKSFSFLRTSPRVPQVLRRTSPSFASSTMKRTCELTISSVVPTVNTRQLLLPEGSGTIPAASRRRDRTPINLMSRLMKNVCECLRVSREQGDRAVNYDLLNRIDPPLLFR